MPVPYQFSGAPWTQAMARLSRPARVCGCSGLSTRVRISRTARWAAALAVSRGIVSASGPSTSAHHARLTSPSNTAISVWPLAEPLLDWEVLT